MIILLAASVRNVPPAKAATAVTTNRWETYANTRYGVVIDYPADLFAMLPPPPDNAGREFEEPRVQSESVRAAGTSVMRPRASA